LQQYGISVKKVWRRRESNPKITKSITHDKACP
jgi:hypothetical protein